MPGKAHIVLIISASSAHYYLLRGQVLLRSHLVCCQMAPKDCPVPLDLKPYLSRLFCDLDPSLPWTRAESPPLSASRAQGLPSAQAPCCSPPRPAFTLWPCTRTVPAQWTSPLIRGAERGDGYGIKETAAGYSLRHGVGTEIWTTWLCYPAD